MLGAVDAPAAVLIRPDGYVAWVGDRAQTGLRDALTTAATVVMREDQKMEQAIGALKYGLKTLQKGDRFNIVAFATEARPFAEKLIDVDESSIAEATRWAGQLTANGGTAIHDALLSALKTMPAAM